MAQLWAHEDALCGGALEGYVNGWPHLIRLDEGGRIVRAAPKPRDRVALVIGNGLGHEPAMVGLVGEGLFDVNVPGRLFEAPSAGRLRDGLRVADREAGVLLCVSNHSGDVLNAELALERYEPQHGPVAMVVLGDDVSSAPPDRAAERRGTAGLLFVWKIVGAAAEQGYDLDACRDLATRVCSRTRTLGVAFGSATHPVTGQRLVDVPPDAVVLGTGVHGEQAGGLLERPTAERLAASLVAPLLDELPDASAAVAVLVNDAGGVAPTERAALANLVVGEVRSHNVEVVRCWFGQYATTFDLRGIAVAVLAVDDELLELYDAPCEGPALASLGRGPVG